MDHCALKILNYLKISNPTGVKVGCGLSLSNFLNGIIAKDTENAKFYKKALNYLIDEKYLKFVKSTQPFMPDLYCLTQKGAEYIYRNL